MSDLEKYQPGQNVNEKEIIIQLAKFIYLYMMRTQSKEIARIFMIEDRLP